MIHGRLLGPTLAAVALTACVSPSDGTPRVAELPVDALGLSGPSYATEPDGWWTGLGDPQLDRLVSEALAANPSLAVALARMRSAAQQANAAGAGLDPRVEFDLNVLRSKVSANYIYPPPYAGSTFWDGRVGFTLTWNLDFWGRQSALIEQATAGARAAALDAEAAALALSGAVAQTYVDYARGVELEAVAAHAVSQREKLVELTSRRVAAGIDGETELQLAKSQRALAGVALQQARLGRLLASDALAALTGQSAAAAGELATPPRDLLEGLALPAVLPSDLIAHRPDVAAARARVEAASAGRDAAEAAFYPNINLVGFGGLTAVGLDSLPKGNSQTWSLGPSIHLPIFDAGRLRAEHARATADLDAAVAAYNEAVLRAIREAADQVGRVRQLDLQLDEQARGLEAAERAFALATQRYEAGLANYLTVITADTSLSEARRNRANLLADRSLAGIALVVALGGGWSDGTAPARAAYVPTESPK